MQGIALGRCRKSDGMIFYCPHNKQVYTSSDYKLDEGRSTPTTLISDMMGGSSWAFTIACLLIPPLNHIQRAPQFPFQFSLHLSTLIQL
jgi:hypothetical protein